MKKLEVGAEIQNIKNGRIYTIRAFGPRTVSIISAITGETLGVPIEDINRFKIIRSAKEAAADRAEDVRAKYPKF